MVLLHDSYESSDLESVRAPKTELFKEITYLKKLNHLPSCMPSIISKYLPNVEIMEYGSIQNKRCPFSLSALKEQVQKGDPPCTCSPPVHSLLFQWDCSVWFVAGEQVSLLSFKPQINLNLLTVFFFFFLQMHENHLFVFNDIFVTNMTSADCVMVENPKR